MEEKYPLAKWLNDEMTEAELEEFKLEPDYHLFQKIKEVSSELQTERFDDEAMLATILSVEKATTKPKVIPLYKKLIFKVAAVLVIGLGLLMTYQSFSSTTQFAENGKEISFFLPDNSEVVLNSSSEIEYKKWNWNNNRTLQLKGEAYFKVAKGKKFEVNTNLGKVSVLGTQFNVKARKNRFDVTCYEGKVKVNYSSEVIILTKGQTVSFENNQKILHHSISIEKPLWTLNQIDFEKEKIKTIIEEIERQYNYTIELKDKPSEELFTGKLPDNNIDVALQIIASTYHLKVIKNNSNSYSLEKIK